MTQPNKYQVFKFHTGKWAKIEDVIELWDDITPELTKIAQIANRKLGKIFDLQDPDKLDDLLYHADDFLSTGWKNESAWSGKQGVKSASKYENDNEVFYKKPRTLILKDDETVKRLPPTPDAPEKPKKKPPPDDQPDRQVANAVLGLTEDDDGYFQALPKSAENTPQKDKQSSKPSGKKSPEADKVRYYRKAYGTISNKEYIEALPNIKKQWNSIFKGDLFQRFSSAMGDDFKYMRLQYPEPTDPVRQDITLPSKQNYEFIMKYSDVLFSLDDIDDAIVLGDTKAIGRLRLLIGAYNSRYEKGKRVQEESVEKVIKTLAEKGLLEDLTDVSDEEISKIQKELYGVDSDRLLPQLAEDYEKPNIDKDMAEAPTQAGRADLGGEVEQHQPRQREGKDGKTDDSNKTFQTQETVIVKRGLLKDLGAEKIITNTHTTGVNYPTLDPDRRGNKVRNVGDERARLYPLTSRFMNKQINPEGRLRQYSLRTSGLQYEKQLLKRISPLVRFYN